MAKVKTGSADSDKAIRSIGAAFVMTNELAEGKYELSFMARCKEVGKDGDDRAIYGSPQAKTLMSASQLQKPYDLKKGSDFPPTVKFEVDAKHRLIF